MLDPGERGIDAAAHRDLLGDAVRLLGQPEPTSSAALVRLAIPLLGDWCIVEEEGAELVDRTVVALDGAVERAAAALNGLVPSADPSLVALPRLSGAGRPERLDVMPEAPGAEEVAVRAIDALGDGPALLVPVTLRGRVSAAALFGRSSRNAAPYGPAEMALAADVAGLLALALEQRRTAAAAADASRVKAEFLTMMSHELRTPLNAIAGYAQLLEMGFRGPLNDDQREAVGRILKGQEHLLELVDAVLTFSRLTSGRIVIDPVDLSAATLLDLALDPLRRDFAEREIALTVTGCAVPVRVIADHERAPQVLRHLLSNALKFTAPGGAVSVRCSAGTSTVRFEVEDSGCGIPASQQEAIFHPFVQVEKGHTRSADGSGLGLAIARELALRMGGALTVTSEVGAGSRFVLVLPRGEDGASAAGGALIDTTGGPG